MAIDRKCQWCQKWFPWKPRRGTSRGLFCSRACAARWLLQKRGQLTPEARRKGAVNSALARRQQALAKLTGLTPIQVYRMAYQAGWRRGVRYARGLPAARDAA